jgi:hypothetical protein
MHHVFLVALFLCIAGHGAQAQEKAASATATSQPAAEVLVEDGGSGALLISLRGLPVARCAIADEKFACEATSPMAAIVPSIKGEPAPEGYQTSDGAP